ncbi:hypothetical protein [Marinobacter sp. CHS3-4]|uniref:hypothetical protein n=1 Tax=Marinobacter sp. CHS3-4 TaxID=3045174 RepID=UPI0024B4B60A|nr:hypothetical protein [Marinobacter sp. CHS3-4]MDI9244606.1 hypothetical protein [Marinobacter sp. CHS3-4]
MTHSNWQSRKGWESPRIRSDRKRTLLLTWVMALMWNAISTPLLWTLPKALDENLWLILMVVAFPAVGLGLLWKAVSMTREYRHYGTVELVMDPYPAAIGGQMGGTILVPRLGVQELAASGAEVSVTLECIYTYVSGSGKNRTRKERILWAERGTPKIETAGQGVRLAFRFDLPGDLPEADIERSSRYHFWRLSVKADIEGVDLERQYDIPAFQGDARSHNVEHDISTQVRDQRNKESQAAKEAIQSGQLDLPGLSRAMHYQDYGHQIKMRFPMFRNKMLSVFAWIFAGGFGFASTMMLTIAFSGGAFGVFVGLFSVPFVLVAIAAGAAALYLPFNRLIVRIDRQGIRTLRSWLYLPVLSRKLAMDQIGHLTIKRTGSTGQGVDKVEHFKIIAVDNEQKKVTIAEDLDGKDVAQHFCDYLAERIGVSARKMTS